MVGDKKVTVVTWLSPSMAARQIPAMLEPVS